MEGVGDLSSAESSQALLWEMQFDSWSAAYGGLQELPPALFFASLKRTMYFSMASAPALAITGLSQVTLNLVHSRLYTSAHKINLLKPGQLCKTSRQTKLRQIHKINCLSSLRPFKNVALLADEISSVSVYLQYKTEWRPILEIICKVIC